MNQIQDQGQAIANAFTDLFSRFINFLPALIGAIVVVIIGLIIASALAKLVEKVVRMLKIDHVIATLQEEIKGRQGKEIKASVLLREIVRWLLIFVFLTAAAEILGLSQLSAFLGNIILYIPNIVVAVIILTVALMLAKYVSQIVMESQTVAASKFESKVISGIAKWAIIIFGTLAALIQLGIAPALINSIAIGIIAAVCLAIGLAFGLGGQNEAAQILKNFREKMIK
ncbi:MAG: TM helix repeat-containing protein [uncultured bacterium]|nr:MAG: TM helix repeat-containing protein [uncultured bacterium]